MRPAAVGQSPQFFEGELEELASFGPIYSMAVPHFLAEAVGGGNVGHFLTVGHALQADKTLINK